MTDRRDGDTRALRLRLRSAPEAGAEERIRAALGALSPALACRLDGRDVRVEYPFPELSAAEIRDALFGEAPRADFTPAAALLCGLRAFLERNERERLSAARGWRHAAREAYAQCYERRRGGGDPRRQQWRKSAYTRPQ